MENKITKKSKQQYFKLNRCMSSVKFALLISPIFMLFFWYICIPGMLYDVIWKDIVLMISIGWIVSVIYLVLLLIAPVDLEEKTKNIEESRKQNILRMVEAEQRGQLQILKKLKDKEEQFEIQMKVLQM